MEITLYDLNGKAIAYVAPKEGYAIYMWNGNAVCYLDGDKIYGWKGKHIGWFVDDIVYDISGKRVGFTNKTCPVVTYVEPVKYVKYVQYVKYVKNVPYVKPVFTYSNSNLKLNEFLEQDKP